jgi:hypothetical protein
VPDVETELRRFFEVEAARYVPGGEVGELVERRSRRRRPVVFGAIAACALVIVGAVAVVVAEHGSGPGTVSATTPSSANVPANAIRLAGSTTHRTVVIAKPGDYVLEGTRGPHAALLAPTLAVSPDVCDYLEVSLAGLRAVSAGDAIHARAVLRVVAVRRPVVLAYEASLVGTGAPVRNLGVAGAPPCLQQQTNEASRAAAEAEAHRLLALVPVGGETYTGALPRSLAAPAISPANRNLVDEHRVWTTTTAPDAVVANMRAHPPTGLKEGGGGSSSGPAQDTVRFATLVPTQGPTQAWRALVVSAVHSGGDTFVRVDAEVVWLPTRSPGEWAPYRTEAVLANGHPVTDATKVRALVAAFNREPTDTGAVRHCPGDTGERTRVEFVAPAGTHRVIATAGFCGLVTVTVDGHTATTLQDTEQLATLAA